jgi:hypothetical protein
VAPSTSAGAGDRTRIVQSDEVVAVTAAGDVVRVAADGSDRGLVGRIALDVGAEVDAVDVSPDGAEVVVSVLNDHDEACQADVHLFSAAADGAVIAEGAAASFSPDGTRLLYLQYRADGEFCPRTRVVVRSLADRAERRFALPGGGGVEGNPGEWPVDWSPDSRRIALVAPHGVLLADADGTHVTTLAAAAGTDLAATAPVFLDDDTLLAVTGCCVGAAHVTEFSLDGGGARPAFEVPTAVRSIRRDRDGAGVWLTLEDRGLWHWDGTTVTQVAPDYLLASG